MRDLNVTTFTTWDQIFGFSTSHHNTEIAAKIILETRGLEIHDYYNTMQVMKYDLSIKQHKFVRITIL